MIKHSPNRSATKKISSNPGDATLNVPAQINAVYFLLKDAIVANPTVSVGTAPGGTDILDNVVLSNGIYSVLQSYYFAALTTLYITSSSIHTQLIIFYL